ncbi:MAG: ABC transporter permease [Candidatus Gastranaerophilales bacterium]|nr:ABC transporter permease [Candidatus Gastranaerophilales bacterium]
MMDAFIAVFLRELRRIKNQKKLIFPMFILPIILCFLIFAIFKSGMPRNLPIAVYNADNSSLSRTYVRMLEASPTLNVAYQTTDMQEGRDLIVSGKAYAFIYIPRDFQRDIYKNKAPQLVYYYNNQLLLVGGIVSKEIVVVTRTLMGGINLAVKQKLGVPKGVAMSQLNVVEIDEHVNANPYLNYSYFLGIVSFAHILQILACCVCVWAVGTEFKNGSAIEWLECADNSILIGVLGKIFPYFLSFLFLTLFVDIVYFGISGMPLRGNIPFVILTTVLFILAYQLMGAAFVAYTGSLRFALSSGAFYTALGFTFAGVTYPQIGMPAFAKFYSSLLPISHYMKIMLDQTLRGIPWKYDMPSLYGLIVIILLALCFFPRLKRLALDKTQWYKN